MGKNPFARLFRRKDPPDKGQNPPLTEKQDAAPEQGQNPLLSKKQDTAPDKGQNPQPPEKQDAAPQTPEHAAALADLEWQLLRGLKLEKSGGEYSMTREDFDFEHLSRYETWTDELLDSRRGELQENGPALARQRKILTFRDADPAQYERLKGELPAVSEEKRRQVREIMEIELAWAQASLIQLPDTWRREPSLDREKAIAYGEVSFETGLESELLTYGEETLRLYRRMVDDCKAADINLIVRVFDNKAKRRGFMSAQALEAHIRRSYATPC